MMYITTVLELTNIYHTHFTSSLYYFSSSYLYTCMNDISSVFGGTPWDMMSFLLLLMDWRGFTKNQIVTIQITSGTCTMLKYIV